MAVSSVDENWGLREPLHRPPATRKAVVDYSTSLTKNGSAEAAPVFDDVIIVRIP